MKLLFCEVCHDIIAPFPREFRERSCCCGAHSVWWVNSARGELRVYSKSGVYDFPNENFVGGVDKQPCWQRKRSPHEAFVIGIHNGFLGLATNTITLADVNHLLATCPSTYIFKQIGSLVIRIRPGQSSDTDWSEFLPVRPVLL